MLQAAERFGFTGLNVTHPYKQHVIPLLDELSDMARGVGAVNTIVFRGGKRIGYNTDASGFWRAFQTGLPGETMDDIVQVGAGGAGSATAFALLRHGAGRIGIYDSSTFHRHALVDNLRRHSALSAPMRSKTPTGCRPRSPAPGESSRPRRSA